MLLTGFGYGMGRQLPDGSDPSGCNYFPIFDKIASGARPMPIFIDVVEIFGFLVWGAVLNKISFYVIDPWGNVMNEQSWLIGLFSHMKRYY
jgi:hypothetical protein